MSQLIKIVYGDDCLFRTQVYESIHYIRIVHLIRISDNSWFLLHDDAPFHHRVALVNSFLAKNHIVMLNYSLYSPDICSFDFSI
ncbi:hypothetical protein ALC56_01717 [Trachymyrmex septentrionalis]|uniref:Histone-lysine N-methyltransferase SETMAR n=1 Tax=Trachymyrmex septentrionalis TaxID=34720 RepID=A0A195FU77_9HYME|nr:hypothetical protein ALC56_01717 [Trachymyrmex septentrionalis]